MALNTIHLINQVFQTCQHAGLLKVYTDNKLNIEFNLLPDDNFFYLSKLKQIADNILKCI